MIAFDTTLTLLPQVRVVYALLVLMISVTSSVRTVTTVQERQMDVLSAVSCQHTIWSLTVSSFEIL